LNFGASATVGGLCHAAERQPVRRPGVRAIRAALFGLCLLLAAGASQPTPCVKSFAVFYDELHSFEVSAPAGWCCSEVGAGYSCSPAGSKGSPTGILVAFRYLATTSPELDVLAPTELASLAPGASASEQPAIRTQQGASVRVWQVSGPNPDQERLVGLLIHEMLLVRFVLEPASSSSLASNAEAFQQLVSSFRGSAPAA
jgi:hypothetical protein